MTMPPDDAQRERTMTVLKVRVRDDCAEAMFAESARIYRVPRTSPRFEQTVRELSTATGGRVRVRLDAPNGVIIEDAARDAPAAP